MRFHKRSLQLWRLLLSWTAVVSLVWIPVAFVLGAVWGQSAGFTTMCALAPLIPVLIKRQDHFYLMARNYDFNDHRID